jgi:polyisoprenoid-binding protein YceI
MHRWLAGLVAVATGLGIAGAAEAATWKVDEDHTTVGFGVKHLFTRVQGRFDEFEGTIEFDAADPKAVKVSGTIQAASINTNNAKRDKHLRSADFFDVEKYPTLSFASTGVRAIEANGGALAGEVEGELTIRGVTKPVVIAVAFIGQGTDPWGNVRAGFTAELEVNRKDYGLNWNEVLETGGVLVGDIITIRIDVEGILAE